MSWSEIVADFQANWWIYLSMPVMAAVIGYVTKLLAVQMMFKPLEFKGIPPYLGWQGMLPRRAPKMASIAYDMITNNLVDLQEVMGRIDPDDLAREMRGPMNDTIAELAESLLVEYQPGLWETLPDQAKRLLIRRAQAEAPRVLRQLAEEIRKDIHSVVDVRHMVVSNLSRDKDLVNRLIKDIATPEIKFLVRSGIYFGSIIGLVQMCVWALTHNALVMPIFGFATGWITDYVALNMLFVPNEPRRFLGLKVHGLFLRRQHEVASVYGELIAKEILTPRNLFEGMLTGPKSDRLIALVQKEVQRTIDRQAGIAKPLVVLAVGGRRYREMKQAAVTKVIETAPDAAESMFEYTEKALDIKSTIREKMRELTPTQFIQILRPAFKEDEKTAIAVGAILGGLVGELQAFLVVHLPQML
ncbi:uncharacterized membrane protein YheB (UPF0754 family) [Herbihabitans rhizosphaerae]|uniref:Uncharacterized membrane protein YheB (UPF0754 family) n=1 Tax=Herbihabitans rhizosphaerae TaxID=1872711 RepID=A0A4Q7L3Y7_9PSEU|nr:DUF445 domain-containing protein [Herbihabitans rhizosphaerae]RZS43480.1 uncharacterized membrane protein YheB (UPF0754 family) [Herbihabitans rhizosphaerae]